jgi:hypothetical protein
MRLRCALASVVVLTASAATAFAQWSSAALAQPFPAHVRQPSRVGARLPFRPRIGVAMGIVPSASVQDVATGSNIPVLYHGGPVMSQVTVHTIFWAPSGYQFDGPPAAGLASYEQQIQKFFVDVAHDSGTTGNVFSILQQYRDGRGTGSYAISYDPAADSIDDTDPYPAKSGQCPSPAGIATCVTDLELQHEIDSVIGTRDPSGRGLHDLWFVFLPPDVDTCVSLDQCGTNVFAGYHAMSDLGSPGAVYSVIPDPLIEGVTIPGADPEGNPEAEAAINAAAHETIEALTNPDGTAWMDPNGFEVGDKCETQDGRLLGSASDGSPYNQLIDGDQYLIQMMWSNSISGCVQRSTATSSALPLATVDLRQFSSTVSGSIGTATRGVSVTIVLGRAGTAIAGALTATRASGSWGPVSLTSLVPRGGHTIGDDRDEILILYGQQGPAPDLIETGDGGNPFTEAGWTGWFDLDHGYAVRPSSILLAPCGQTGVLSLTINRTTTPPPVDRCETETDVAVTPTASLGARSTIGMSSEDNRAVSALNPNGALVSLTVPLGEPQSASSVANREIMFTPSGFPTCMADLRAQSVRCSGLVPGARYTLARLRRNAVRHGRADGKGSVVISAFPGPVGITGGDALALTNGSGRTLSVLHVAHLRVDLRGEQTVIAGGSCEPGDYWGQPPTAVPNSAAAGVPGLGGTGMICPLNGRAGGLPATPIEQTDDQSGGLTQTEVPQIEATSPTDGETLYGPFVALARTGLPGPSSTVLRTWARVAVTIARSTGGPALLRVRNVDTARGVAQSALPRGVYTATWVLTDVNGDTRTVKTEFAEA